MPSMFRPGTLVRVTVSGDRLPPVGSIGRVMRQPDVSQNDEPVAAVDFYGVAGYTTGRRFNSYLLSATGREVRDENLEVYEGPAPVLYARNLSDYALQIETRYGGGIPRPGDRVRLTAQHDMAPAGITGVFLGPNGSRAGSVKMDAPHRFGHWVSRRYNLDEAGSGYNMPIDRLEVIEAGPPLPMDRPISIGDIVVGINSAGSTSIGGLCGEVMTIEGIEGHGASYGVSWFSMTNGHSLDGRLENDRAETGLYVARENIRPLAEGEPVAGVDYFVLGSKVILVSGREGIIVSRDMSHSQRYGVRIPGFSGGHNIGGLLSGDQVNEGWMVTRDDIQRGWYNRRSTRAPNPLPTGTKVVRNGLREPGFDGGPPIGSVGEIIGTGSSTSDAIDRTYTVLFLDPNTPGCTTANGNLDTARGYLLKPAHFTVVEMPLRTPATAIDTDRLVVRPAPARPARRPGYGQQVSIASSAGLTRFGIRPGTQGTVVSDISENQHMCRIYFGTGAGVDGEPWGSFENTVMVPTEQISGYQDTRPEGETLFKVGDPVELVSNDGRTPPVGTEGVVTAVSGLSIEVDFHPYRWKHGKDVFSTGHKRSGYVLASYYLKKIEVGDSKPLKAFYLVGVKDGGVFPIPDDPGYDSGREASEAAKVLSEKLGHKVQARKNAPPDPNWREREKKKFEDGQYKPMPKGWDLEPIEDHFLHLSNKQPGFIAFTPSKDYGEQDRQVFSRPGAYLKKYYPKLSASDVMRYGAIASCDGNLEIVTDSESIVRAYRNGPDSCMKYDFKAGEKSGIRLPAHPAEVYGESDLALALLKDQKDRIISRCLVWPEKMMFTRGYGDIAKIYAMLEALGYKRGNFQGARIKRIPFPDGGAHAVVCPYIDDAESVQGSPKALGVRDDGRQLIIDEFGFSTNITQGWFQIPKEYRMIPPERLTTCERTRCSRTVDRETTRSVITARNADGSLRRQQWCADCTAGRTYVCSGLDEPVAAEVERGQDMLTGRLMSSIYLAQRGGLRDAITGGYFFDGDARILADGSVVHASTFRHQCYVCAGSGQAFSMRTPNHVSTYVDIGRKRYNLEWLKANKPELLEDQDKKISEVKKKFKGSISSPYTSTLSVGVSLEDILRDIDETRNG